MTMFRVTNNFDNITKLVNEKDLQAYDKRVYSIVSLDKYNLKKHNALYMLQVNYRIMTSYRTCTCASLSTITASELNNLYKSQHNRIYKSIAFFVYTVIDKCDYCKESETN